MKTTELFVEQVLIGALVLLTAVLILWSRMYAILQGRTDRSLVLIVAGAIFVGAAYLIGMVYDRVADTLLQDLESHCRLQFALDPYKLKDGKVRTAASSTDEAHVRIFDRDRSAEADLFTEGKYRITVLSNAEATAQMEYLRSRIRLTRAMTTIIPALMVGLLLAVTPAAGVWWSIAALGIPAAYLAILLLKLVKQKPLCFHPPKTYQVEKVNAYVERAGFLPGKESVWPTAKLIAYDEVWLGLALLTVSSVGLVMQTETYALLLLIVIGLVLTILVGWTWWRISRSFYAFVRDFSKYGAQSVQITGKSQI